MRLFPFIPKMLILFSMMLISSCSGSQNRSEKGKKSEIPLETYININRSLVSREQDKIKAYLDSVNLDMKTTGSGLWYIIDEPGEGLLIESGQTVRMDYRIRLLDGTVCYDSDNSGPREFMVGRGGVESGLEEGVLLLREGSRARFIMPPHLAHGLIGDDARFRHGPSFYMMCM
ncbi:FKBP-type peptidyl-prolyl cis-trans isomerase [Marinilabilia salmonicolor]|uniref:FKBP-type peptidyl-prolyl cis-trans isomerase n=1 Tax=Marinilabilia salmonicolor TaxID=989 RepID=UPI001F35B5AD|nr:FKBP-type peptidyl-prolyl cis-trans isomerase [Marinilabilia salmonicolor]